MVAASCGSSPVVLAGVVVVVVVVVVVPVVPHKAAAEVSRIGHYRRD